MMSRFQLPVEAVSFYSNFPFVQLIVRLPEGVSFGDLIVTVSVDGRLSNPARISIQQYEERNKVHPGPRPVVL
jgi:hypothetical protein